jgi:hypothetical protein
MCYKGPVVSGHKLPEEGCYKGAHKGHKLPTIGSPPPDRSVAMSLQQCGRRRRMKPQQCGFIRALYAYQDFAAEAVNPDKM